MGLHRLNAPEEVSGLVEAGRHLERPDSSELCAHDSASVDDLAELVDGTELVPPGASDLHVGLIDVPAIPDDVPTKPGGLGELWSEPLNPPVHNDVVNVKIPRSARSSSTFR